MTWLRSIFAWRTIFEAGVYAYQENRVTGRRRACRIIAGGYSPRDAAWLAGEPRGSGLGAPPTGYSGAVAR